MSPQTGELTARHRKAVLAVIALALMMVVSAVSGLNVALPDLALDTGATQTQVTWIVDAYTLVFVGLLLPAGAAGDRFGRRGALLVGLVVFGLAAAAAMFVENPTTLIGLRAAMGVGAAFVMPATLSVITTSFPPEERGRAVGVWVGVAGGGAVLGLFVSGALLEVYDWNSFFGLNVTLAVLALIGTLTFVPSSRDADAAPLDGVGALLSLVGLAALVYGIIEGPEQGWADPLTIVGFAVGAVGLVAFVLWELRRERPMLDPRLFRLRGFGTGSLVLTVQFFGSFGLFFVIIQYLQYVAGLSPLMSATAMLPLPFVLIPLARNAPRIAARVGINRIVALGLALSGTGMLMLTGLTVDLTYWYFALSVAVFAAGMGLAGTPATTAIVSSLPSSQQGVASAVNDTSRELGSVMGIAILGSALNAAYRDGLVGAVPGLPQEILERAQDSISFVVLGGDRLGQLGEAGQQLVAAAEQSFVDATSTAFLIAAGTLYLGAVVSFFRAPKQGEDHPVPGAATGVASSRPTRS
jgi:EmrB/QacA subfamily drug resistance transporter